MPARTERRRNMNALSAFHNLDFTYPRVFNKSDADSMAAANKYLINGTHLACYLSHLHVYKQMIEDNIETALVLEDDVDMELDLMHRHEQIMQQVYEQYGRDWDMLYLGHCTWDRNEPVRSTKHNVSLYQAEYPVCMHAYAVTRDCAQRLAVLLEERLTTVGRDIDMILAVGVMYGVSIVLGTSPPYIVQIGRRELVSDLALLEDGDTAQSLTRSTLFHLNMRSTDPRTLPAYMIF
ncbi:hypothetical protein IW148_000372 [Coemansia sp. RSA 1199]|nr:hypothetical protein IW148_000372 [Coemansia sp. RSA 1199]